MCFLSKKDNSKSTRNLVAEYAVASGDTGVQFPASAYNEVSIDGSMVECLTSNQVTRVRFPVDA